MEYFMEYLTVSEARKKIPTLATASKSTVLTSHGKPVAVLTPIDEYRALQALLKLATKPVSRSASR